MREELDLEDQVVAHVRRAAAVRGHGVLGRGHERAGLSPAYLRNMPSASVGLGRLRVILQGCDLDPEGILRHALDSGAIARFVADARRLAPGPKDFPAVVKDTVARMRAWQPEQSDGADLEAIDALRDHDPRAALRAIEEVLGRVSGPKTYAKALGIWGSAQRVRYRLDYATMGIGLAIEAAQAADDSALVCGLLVRAAYVLRDRGELDWAIEISDALLGLHASRHDMPGMGTAFVLRGSLLSSAGHPGQAVDCNQAGLHMLAPGAHDWRFMAYQNMSVDFEAQGDLTAADKATQAAQALGITTPNLLGRLAWSRARIAYARKDPEQAAGLFKQAFGLLAAEAIDAGLVGAEWVRVLLEAGRGHEAHKLAASLAPIADTISEHPIDFDQVISAALLDLALAGGEAKASVALVARVVEAIEHGQAAGTDRLRRDLRL